MTYIEQRDGVCGGEPIAVGTRVSLYHLQELIYGLGWTWEKIYAEYPHVPMDTMRGALTLWFNTTDWRSAQP